MILACRKYLVISSFVRNLFVVGCISSSIESGRLIDSSLLYLFHISLYQSKVRWLNNGIVNTYGWYTIKGTGGCDIFLKTNLGGSGIISLLKSSSISSSVSCSISSNSRSDILFRQFRLPECFPDFLICTRGLLTFWIVQNIFLNIFDIDVYIYQYIEKSWIYFLYSCMCPSNIFNFTK